MGSFFTRTKLIVILLLLQFSSIAQDSTYPKPQDPSKLVNDFADVMSYSQSQWLEDKLVKFDKETSTQISIITVNTTNGIDIADYAIEIGNQWGIGREKKNNGVIILAAMNDHKVTIMTGYGLEGALPDVLCKQIIDNEITPAFKESDYYTGFDRAADAIISATKGEYKAGSHYSKPWKMPRWLLILSLIIGINGVMIGLPLLIRYLIEKITGKKFKRSTSYYTYSNTATQEETKSSDSSSSSGSSNESFGGYGGGRFGGGGATGSW